MLSKNSCALKYDTLVKFTFKYKEYMCPNYYN